MMSGKLGSQLLNTLMKLTESVHGKWQNPGDVTKEELIEFIGNFLEKNGVGESEGMDILAKMQEAPGVEQIMGAIYEMIENLSMAQHGGDDHGSDPMDQFKEMMDPERANQQLLEFIP
jgi:hypothetical protein